MRFFIYTEFKKPFPNGKQGQQNYTVLLLTLEVILSFKTLMIFFLHLKAVLIFDSKMFYLEIKDKRFSLLIILTQNLIFIDSAKNSMYR